MYVPPVDVIQIASEVHERNRRGYGLTWEDLPSSVKELRVQMVEDVLSVYEQHREAATKKGKRK